MIDEDRAILLVLTEYRRDYERFCLKYDLNPRDGRIIRWIKNPDGLRGYRRDWLLVLDYLHPDVIEELVRRGEHVLVPEPKDWDSRYRVRDSFPKVSVNRGGIKFT